MIFAEIVDGDDILVGDVRGQPRLLQKTSLGLDIPRGYVGEYFQRYAPAEHVVLSAVNARHAAPQELLDFVFADARGMFHHRVTGATHFSVDKKSLLKTAGPPPVSTRNS